MAELPIASTPGTEDAYSMTDIMGASHTVYDGSGLPMDDLPLEEPGEATSEPAATSTPTPTPTPEPTPLRYSSQAEAERALAEATERERRFLEQQTALQQEMATLRQQVQDRTTPQTPQVTTPAPDEPAAIYRRTFEAIEALDPSTDDYAGQRATLYADAELQIQRHLMGRYMEDPQFQAVIDARVQARTQEALTQHDTQRQMLTERSSVVETAMRLGKERGYDIREPGDMTSNDSILFWAHAAQIPNEGSIETQATQAFTRMPQRAQATTTQPTTTRVQPMARSGATAPTTTPAEEDGPFSLDAIMHAQRERQRIGRAA